MINDHRSFIFHSVFSSNVYNVFFKIIFNVICFHIYLLRLFLKLTFRLFCHHVPSSCSINLPPFSFFPKGSVLGHWGFLFCHSLILFLLGSDNLFSSLCQKFPVFPWLPQSVYPGLSCALICLILDQNLCGCC